MQFKTLALVGLAATASAQTANLTTALQNQTSLSNLTQYLGLYPSFVGQLEQLQNITLLAPNNDAFNKLLNSSAGAAAVNNTALITALFSYHVLNGTYPSFGAVPQFIPTLLEPPTFANVTGGQRVEAIGSGNTSTFFTGLLQNATSTGSPLTFTGGLIYILDSFLTIPQNISTTAVDLGLSAVAGALGQANLVEAVDDTPEVTVFAPSNAAFAAVGSALANVSNSTLADVLKYHVVAGVVGYSTLLTNTSLTTLAGTNLTITVDNGTVFVNQARVSIPDVLVTNGVVHVIDEVLNPANNSGPANAQATAGSPAYANATSVSGTPFTSGVPAATSSVTASATAKASSSSGAAYAPMKTGAVGAAALFGGAAVMLNM